MSDGGKTKSADYRMAARVAMCGAAGGLLSWLAGCLARGDGNSAGLTSVFAIIPLGAGAAVLGIYVVTNTDTDDKLRCLAFALACGFTWQPVYEGASALVKQTTEARAQNEVEQDVAKVDEIAERVTNATGAAIPAALEEAATAAARVIEKASRVSDFSVRARAFDAVEQLTAAMSQRVADDPDATVDALADVALAAAERQAPDVARRSWEVTESAAVAAMEPATALRVVAKARDRQTAVQRAASRAGDRRFASYVGRSTAESAIATGARVVKDPPASVDQRRITSLRLADAARELDSASPVRPRGAATRAPAPRQLDDNTANKLASDPELMRRYLVDRSTRSE